MANEAGTKKNSLKALVAIGASAGGLTALKTLFANMPTDADAAYVVVVHLSPEHKSHLADLLQPHTKLPVQQVTGLTEILPNSIYVIPPNANLNAADTHLRLSNLEGARRERAPIDHFFRTVGETHDGHAIGVVLTGTGSDGTLGLRWIRERGGIAIVQDPEDAEYDGMPRSVIAAGAADVIAPLAGIPTHIQRIAESHPKVAVPEDGEPTRAEQERILQKIFAQIRARTGHDFTHYKRSTLLRRIRRRMQLHHLEELSSYLELLRQRPEETLPLYNDLLITVTEFFRDREVFERLASQAIPALMGQKGSQDRIRVWSVGCSTGEEAYSLAILLLEEAARREIRPQIQIFASDLHDKSVARAREGIYPETIAAEVSEERLRKFFTKENGSYRVRKEVRELVVFAPHDLLKDPPFSHLDLIVCRNVLIYLQRDAQQEVISLFHYALREGGQLLLGTAETVDAGDLFSAPEKGFALFRRRATPMREPRLPVFPVVPRRFRERDATPDSPVPPASFGALHAKMVEQYAPPSILIGRDHDVVHVSSNAGRYLQVPSGEATSNVYRLLRDPLPVELRSLIHAVREQGKAVRSRAVTVSVDGQLQRVVLQVRPATGDLAGFLLVLFDELEEVARPSGDSDEPATSATAAELEAELELSRQRLQALVEEYETSQEEMQASNEELQSANKELRSTLEELETSKEELQSMNEELATLNQENRHRVDELSQLSGDLQNLLAATDIATLFLDRDLRIVRFTPRVDDLFNIRHSDRGRPLSDLTHHLGYDELSDDARRALERLVTVEREVSADNGRWYLSRTLPYRTLDDRIEGVVITLIDITERTKAEQALRKSENRIQSLLEIDAVGVLFFSPDGTLIQSNPAFFRMTGYNQDDIRSGRLTWQALTPNEWMGVSLQQMEILERTGRIGPYEKEYLHKDGSRSWMLFAGARLEDGTIAEFCIDIADRKAAEQARRESEERLRLLNEDLERRVAERTAELQERERRLQALTFELSQAETQERARLAHVLHDDAQQALVAAQMRLNLIDKDPLDHGAREDLRQSIVLLDQCQQTLRTLAGDLAPPALQERGLVPALEWLAKRIAEKHRLRVNVQADPDADPRTEGLQTVVFQIVRELLLNVVKHAKTDEAKLQLARTGDEVVLEVRDEGCGFDPVAAESAAGESFGLFHARERLRHVGGTLVIASSPGDGSCITIRVPAMSEANASEGKRSATAGAAPPPHIEPGSVIRVLLADDHQTVREGLARSLERESRLEIVGEAGDGAEVAAAVRRFQPHVVVMDVNMPEMNGIETTRRLKVEFPGIRVIGLSLHEESDMAKAMLEAGAEAYFSRGGPSADLIAAILAPVRNS